MAKVPSAFYAYPSQPPAIGETIEAAAGQINRGRRVRIRTWRALNPTGRVIINQITDAIDAATVFACDLTYQNPNVLFELGYAIAKRKRVWISLDPTISGAREGFNS